MIVRPSDEEMLDAACTVFAEAGFHAATMEEIATRARTTKPTLYAHFGAKEDLYRKCAEWAADALGTRLLRVYAEAAELSLEEQVRASTDTFFAYAAANPAKFLLLFGADPIGAVTAARQRLTGATAEEIAARIRDFTERKGQGRWGVSAELCAALIVGASVEGARHALFREELDPAAAGAFATSFMTAALRHLDPRIAAEIDGTTGPDSGRVANSPSG
ncbi:TetR/AcrR family transcriptional regulator [Streptomyces pathocidini]|uniref:TetR/AcrR family transcriptional regulator n=1 Tax=Streptomyces pathocidini TaxID=1650571 RepID=UPI0033FC01BE